MTTAVRKLTELEEALHYFANAYFGGVVGSEWDDACDHAEFIANNFRWRDADVNGGPHSDSVVAQFLYGEAYRYEQM